MNRVEELQTEIKNIQETCTHQFEIIKKPVLLETLVENVFVGAASGILRYPKGDERIGQTYDPRFTLKCLKCSIEFPASIVSTCPRCYSSMKKWDQLEKREKYFGTEYIYYAVRIVSCSKGHECSTPVFSIAYDEWDQ